MLPPRSLSMLSISDIACGRLAVSRRTGYTTGPQVQVQGQVRDRYRLQRVERVRTARASGKVQCTVMELWECDTIDA